MNIKPFRWALVGTAAGAALVAAGCGSSSRPSASGGGGGGQQSGVQAAHRYATCMRKHGVTNFPDPVISISGNSVAVKIAVPASVGQSPAFRTAQQACEHILPGPQNESPAERRQHTQDLLAFARCLRDHGLPNFPDPNAQGQLTLGMISAAGIDLHQPGVLTAAKACIGVTHGAITMANVEQAINGPH
jgi:hypothetical protein